VVAYDELDLIGIVLPVIGDGEPHEARQYAIGGVCADGGVAPD